MRNRFFLFQLIVVIVLSACFFSCGGGSKGTGAVELNGKVVTTSGVPLADATVFVAESGDSGTTDSEGVFMLSANVDSAELNLQIVSDTITASAKIVELPASYSSISVVIEVDTSSRTARVEELVVDGKSSEGGSGSESPRPNPNETPRASGSPSPTASVGPEPTAAPSLEVTPEPTQNPAGPSTTFTPSPTPTREPESEEEEGNEGEDAEAEGAISALSSTAMTVRGQTFVLSTTTRYWSEESPQLTLADFSVGDQVHIVGEWRGGKAIALSVLKKVH